MRTRLLEPLRVRLVLEECTARERQGVLQQSVLLRAAGVDSCPCEQLVEPIEIDQQAGDPLRRDPVVVPVHDGGQVQLAIRSRLPGPAARDGVAPGRSSARCYRRVITVRTGARRPPCKADVETVYPRQHPAADSGRRAGRSNLADDRRGYGTGRKTHATSNSTLPTVISASPSRSTTTTGTRHPCRPRRVGCHLGVALAHCRVGSW